MKFDIYFRAFKIEDAELINELRNIPEYEDIIGGNKKFVSLEREKKWVEDIILNDDQSKIYLSICKKMNDEMIGYISISDIDYRNGKCNFGGIKIKPGPVGYGFQAVLLLVKFIFEEMRIERCSGECLENHENMINLLLRAGFKKEGFMRNYVYKNGKYNNIVLLSILSNEYLEIRNKFKI